MPASSSMISIALAVEVAVGRSVVVWQSAERISDCEGSARTETAAVDLNSTPAASKALRTTSSVARLGSSTLASS